MELDQETLNRLRKLPAAEAFEAAKTAAYNAGSVGSEEFLDVYDQLVEQGILSWDQVQEFDR